MKLEVGPPEIPVAFVLHQNYHNPFNPQTAIEFGLPKRSKVIIELFNILGRKIAALFEGTLEAGIYELSLAATEYSSGIYFYRMTAGSFIAVKKMLFWSEFLEVQSDCPKIDSCSRLFYILQEREPLHAAFFYTQRDQPGYIQSCFSHFHSFGVRPGFRSPWCEKRAAVVIRLF